MNICPPASVCVCVWLPAHPNVWTSWRAASRTAARSSWADCIIGGKAATLTWAYNGIVVRQGSRFLGLPKAITHSFFPDPPIFDFPTDQKNILQFRLIREGFDIKDMKKLALASSIRKWEAFSIWSHATHHFELTQLWHWNVSDMGFINVYLLSKTINVYLLSKKMKHKSSSTLVIFSLGLNIFGIVQQPLASLVFLQFLGANCLQC